MDKFSINGGCGESCMSTIASMNCSPVIIPPSPSPKPIPTRDVVVTIKFKDKNGNAMTENLPGSVNVELVDIIGNQIATQSNNYTINFLSVPVSENNTLLVNVPDFTSNITPTENGFKLELQSLIYEPVENYKVSILNEENGTTNAVPNQGKEGTEITLNSVPNMFYKFDKYVVSPASIEIVDNKFTIQNSDVEVTPFFKLDDSWKITDVTVDANTSSFNLMWTDSTNSDWTSTRVYYKTEDVTDGYGTLAVDSKQKDEYKTSNFPLSNLTSQTKYILSFVPCNGEQEAPEQLVVVKEATTA